MTTALEGGEWSPARPGRILPPGKTRYHCTGDWVGPRAGLDRAENLAPPGEFQTEDPQIRRCRKYFCRPGELALEICTPLLLRIYLFIYLCMV